MTTIYVTDGPHDAEGAAVSLHLGRYLPREGETREGDDIPRIILTAIEKCRGSAGGVTAYLSPAKAREVIAALQAAVDEVEPREPPCTCHLGSKTCERHEHLYRPRAVLPPREQ